MGIINVLPKNIAELIAAGEVIERPSSVIKELVENCIDAKAHSITVEIKNGGTTFMRVTDDGIGIRQEDIRTAFLRHATSKIVEQEDLDAIETLGFRGEALASICAVARVEVLTRHSEESFGIRYCIEGSEETVWETTGCPQGTTFIVRDLFYNVPARMKFLKKDVGEGNAVSVLLDRIALSHPEISFTFIRDGKQTMKTQGDGRLENTIYQVFGKDFYDSLMPVSYTRNHIQVEGFVTKPAVSLKANRSMQMFFINGRYVRTKTAMAALEHAYKGSIMAGKYPSCVLMLTMNCSMLDVNVHPAKLEVRFTNEAPVYEAVYHGVRSAIMQYDTRLAEDDSPARPQYTEPELLVPPVDQAKQLGFSYGKQKAERKFEASGYFSDLPDALQNRPSEKAQKHQIMNELADKADKEPIVLVGEGQDEMKVFSEPILTSFDTSTLVDVHSEPQKEDASEITAELTDEDEPIVLKPLVRQEKREQEAPEPVGSVSDELVTVVEEDKREIAIRYIGEIFSTYIIIEYGKDRLMIIDKHAAHERLIYEKLKHRDAGLAPQLLLEPVPVTLEKDEAEIVMEHQDDLAKTGFDIDRFGERTILIRSVPIMMETVDITESFSEIAEYLCRHRKLIPSEKMEWIYANTACRAAIKGGNKSHPEELIDLVMTLEQHPDIRYCPHGRPIYFFMTKHEIEKMFGRLG